jgi:hypothetical protein
VGKQHGCGSALCITVRNSHPHLMEMTIAMNAI